MSYNIQHVSTVIFTTSKTVFLENNNGDVPNHVKKEINKPVCNDQALTSLNLGCNYGKPGRLKSYNAKGPLLAELVRWFERHFLDSAFDSPYEQNFGMF